MEVLLQYLDELDDACYSALFIVSRPGVRLVGVLCAGVVLAACGTAVH